MPSRRCGLRCPVSMHPMVGHDIRPPAGGGRHHLTNPCQLPQDCLRDQFNSRRARGMRTCASSADPPPIFAEASEPTEHRRPSVHRPSDRTLAVRTQPSLLPGATVAAHRVACRRRRSLARVDRHAISTIARISSYCLCASPCTGVASAAAKQAPCLPEAATTNARVLGLRQYSHPLCPASPSSCSTCISPRSICSMH